MKINKKKLIRTLELINKTPEEAIKWLIHDRDGLIVLTICDTSALSEKEPANFLAKSSPFLNNPLKVQKLI